MKTLVIASLVLFGFDSSACESLNGTLLFVDMNNSKEEVVSAKAAARKLCQEFVYAKTKDEFKSILQSFDSQKKPIETLVLSGHSSQGNFSGQNFNLKEGEEGFTELMDRHPNVRDSVRNLHLWGCYTNNIDKLENRLSKMPNLQYVFGFNHLAPLSRQMTGADFLERSLIYLEELKGKESLESVKSFLDNVVTPGAPGFHFVAAAIYGRICPAEDKTEYYYVVEHIPGGTNSRIQSRHSREACEEKIKEFADYKSEIEKVWYGDKTMPPLGSADSIDPVVNPIRRGIYPWLNMNAYCFPKGFPSRDGKVSTGQVLNLIYFDNVKVNFTEAFKNRLSEAAKVLKNTKAGGIYDQLLENTKSLTRKDVFDLSKKQAEVLKTILSKDGEIPFEQRDEAAKTFGLVDKFLRDLDDECVDLRWIDPNAHIPSVPSSCMTSGLPRYSDPF